MRCAQRLTLQKRSNVKLDFVPPAAGAFNYKLYFMCDSYAGCDQEYDIQVKVAPGEEEDEAAEEDAGSERGGAMDTD